MSFLTKMGSKGLITNRMSFLKVALTGAWEVQDPKMMESSVTDVEEQVQKGAWGPEKGEAT